MAVEFLRASAVHLNPAAVTIQKSNDRDTETESGMASRFPMDTPAREMRVRRRRATSSGDSLQIGGSRASKTTRYRAHDSILTYRPEQFAGGIGQHVSRAPAQPSLELAAIRDMMTKGDSDPRILVREHDLHLNRQQPIIQHSRIA